MSAKILLVEDDEMNRDMLSRRLELYGFRVVQAADGAQGIAMAVSETPDLILLDMNLPEIDGWEAANRLKAQNSTWTIPIIALTAHAMSGDREKAMHSGCDDFETKPVDWERLLLKIKTFLGRQTVASTASALAGDGRVGVQGFKPPKQEILDRPEYFAC